MVKAALRAASLGEALWVRVGAAAASLTGAATLTTTEALPPT